MANFIWRNIYRKIKIIKSTLPNTESIDPNTAIRSPKLIYLIALFNWFVVGKSLVIILIIKKGKVNK